MNGAEGHVIVYARIRRMDLRDEFWFRMENLLGERISPTLYELNIADWDDANGEEEIRWVEDLLEGSRESVIFWKFAGGNYSRFAVGSAAPGESDG